MTRSTSNHDKDATGRRSRREMLSAGAAGALGVIAFDSLENAPLAQAATLGGGVYQRLSPRRREAQPVRRVGSGQRLAGQRLRAHPHGLRVEDPNPTSPVGDGQAIQDPAQPGLHRRTDRLLGRRLQLGRQRRHPQQRAHADHHAPRDRHPHLRVRRRAVPGGVSSRRRSRKTTVAPTRGTSRWSSPSYIPFNTRAISTIMSRQATAYPDSRALHRGQPAGLSRRPTRSSAQR